MTTKSLALWGSLACGLLAFFLAEGVDWDAHSLFILGLATALELTAPKLPGGGYASGLFLFLLVLPSIAGFSLHFSLWFLLAALLMRALVKPEASVIETLASLVSQAWPILVALVAQALLGHAQLPVTRGATAGSLLLYIPLQMIALRLPNPSWEAGLKKKRGIVLERLVALKILSGLVAVLSVGSSVWMLLGLLLFLQFVFGRSVQHSELAFQALLGIKLKKKEQRLERANLDIQALHSSLNVRTKENQVLQSISENLAAARSSRDAGLVLLQIVRRLLVVDSAAIYTEISGEIIFSGTDRERELIPGQPPELVRSAYQSKLLRHQSSVKMSSAATPIAGLGAMFLCRCKEFETRELHLLGLAANRATEALLSARLHEEDKKLIEKSQRNVSRLDLFVEASLLFGKSETREQIFGIAEQNLSKVLTVDRCGWLDKASPFPEGDLKLSFEPQELLGKSLEEQHPLGVSREGKVSSQLAFLVAPVGGEQGALWAYSQQSNLQSEDLHWLSLLASLLSHGLANLRHKKEVLRAKRLAAVGKLAAGLAHEINSPLAAISLGIQGAQHSLAKKPDFAGKKLEATHAPMQRVKGLLDRLLAATDSELVEEDFERLDFRVLLLGVLPELETHLEPHSVELSCELGNGILVRGDRDKLQEVVVNLVLNARDSLLDSSCESARIVLRLNEENSFAVVEVEDNGPGVPSRAADSLFEPFFTTKGAGRGTGLGLSIARETVQRHGGQLKLKSNRTGSCCFAIRIPLAGQGS